MKCIVGLGNIGKEYDTTRHNVGFMIVDTYAEQENLQWTDKTKLHAHIALGDDTVLVKPTTFMNLSGNAVSAVKQFYNISNDDMLVICDDIDRNFGEVRIRQGGSDGGHNGLKDIIAHCGEDFWRLRVGIANEHRSHNDAADFVLNRFSKSELTQLNSAGLDSLAEAIRSFQQESIEPHSWSF